MYDYHAMNTSIVSLATSTTALWDAGDCFSGGGPPSESEGHPLAQRQKRC
jgi:hypothetical protein